MAVGQSSIFSLEYAFTIHMIFLNVNKDVNTLRTTLFDMKVRNDDSDRNCSAYKEVHGNTMHVCHCVMGGSDRQNHE